MTPSKRKREQTRSGASNAAAATTSGATESGPATGATARRAAARRANQPQTFGAALLDWIKSMAMGLLVFLVIRTLALQTYTIISGSMENTFLIGDFIVVNKVAYGATLPGTHARLPGYDHPDRGDIVVFKSNHDTPTVSLVKRLIAAPGDTIAMKDGVVLLNGKAQSEPYIRHTRPEDAGLTDDHMKWQASHLLHQDSTATYLPTRDTWGPLVVPPDSYFMMGDNRDESYDSRYWGFVKKEEVIGRASLIYFSWEASPSDPPLIHHVRWNRVGRSLH
jgi:signal peptidase I